MSYKDIINPPSADELCGEYFYPVETATEALGATRWADVLSHVNRVGRKGKLAVPEEVQIELLSRDKTAGVKLDFKYFHGLPCGWAIREQYPEFETVVTDSFKSRYDPETVMMMNRSTTAGRPAGATMTDVVLTSDIAAQGPQVCCDLMIHFNLHYNHHNPDGNVDEPLTMTITFDDTRVKSIRVAKEGRTNVQNKCFADFLQALVFFDDEIVTQHTSLPQDLKSEMSQRRRELVQVQPRSVTGTFKKHAASKVDWRKEADLLRGLLDRAKSEKSTADILAEHYKTQYETAIADRDRLQEQLARGKVECAALEGGMAERDAEILHLKALLIHKDNQCAGLEKRLAAQNDDMMQFQTTHEAEMQQKDKLIASLSKHMYFLKD